MSNHEADTDRIASHAARIGVFDRGVRTPFAECVESDEEELFDRIMSRLNLDERDCIRRKMRQEREEGSNMAPQSVFRFVQLALTWICIPSFQQSRLWGMIYLLDFRFLIENKPMATKARELGLKRATLSNAAREASELLKVPPSQWMRSEQTVNNNRTARKNHCK